MRSLQAPDAVKEKVLARDENQCRYCGSDKNLDVHHIVPAVDGGDHTEGNLITLCKSCHSIAHSELEAGEHPVEGLEDLGVPKAYVDDPRVDRWVKPILEVLVEGRATPRYIHEQTGTDRHRITSCMSDLVTVGWAEKLTRGLYEITPEGREEVLEDVE